MTKKTLYIPDIGDFSDVAIVELLVKVGDHVQVNDSLLILESDKASMEIPAQISGKVLEVLVHVGDRVSEGSAMLVLEEDAEDARNAVQNASIEHTSAPASTTLEEDAAELVVLGAGPGGYSAAFRAADLGMKVTLIERYPTLGGVCLNVGCIPSKALLHVTELLEHARTAEEYGVFFTEPRLDLEALRAYKDKVVQRLTGGLAAMAKARKINIIQGVAEFTDAHHLNIRVSDGSQRSLSFQQIIVAAGSEAISLPFLPEDPRIIDSTGALALPFIPQRMLVIGGGIIGLEMASVYAALGARIDVAEMAGSLMAGADADLVKVWQKRNEGRFHRIMLKTAGVAAEAHEDGIHIRFEGENAPAEAQVYDLVLVAVGRRPNGRSIGIERAGVVVDDRGFIPVDAQMRSNQAHVFAIGDIVGQPMLAHKAVHEGHVAAEAAAGHKAYFDARVIPSVAFTHPEVAWVGVSEQSAKSEQRAIRKAVFPWAASGRAIANRCDDGLTKLIFDAESDRLIGGAIVGSNAGDMIGEITLAIEMNAVAEDLALTIHPHPTLGESIGMAAEVACGSCTDLPPQKRR